MLALNHFADDEVRGEYCDFVRGWESPEGDTWQLVKLALLDQNDEAVAMILEKPDLRKLLDPINRAFLDLMDDPRLS